MGHSGQLRAARVGARRGTVPGRGAGGSCAGPGREWRPQCPAAPAARARRRRHRPSPRSGRTAARPSRLRPRAGSAFFGEGALATRACMPPVAPSRTARARTDGRALRNPRICKNQSSQKIGCSAMGCRSSARHRCRCLGRHAAINDAMVRMSGTRPGRQIWLAGGSSAKLRIATARAVVLFLIPTIGTCLLFSIAPWMLVPILPLFRQCGFLASSRSRPLPAPENPSNDGCMGRSGWPRVARA